MMRTRLIAVPLVLTAVLGGVAACGGKSDGSNSAACKKIDADGNSFGDSISNTTDLNKLQQQLSALSSKLKSDAKGGSQQLQSAVNTITGELDKAVADAKAGNASAAESDLNGLDDAGDQLDKACPQEASDSSS